MIARNSFHRAFPIGLNFGLLDRYVLAEMLLPFLFGVVAFTSVGTAIGSLFEIIRLVGDKGMPIPVALHLYFLQAPSIIVLTFPMAMLLSTLMSYNRLSGDSELTALRSCGVSPHRLLAPAIALGIVVTGLTFLFNEAIVPQANHQAEELLATVLGQHRRIRSNNILYQEFGDRTQNVGADEEGLNRMFYARRFDGDLMRGITVLDFSQTDSRQIVVAQEGSWQDTDGAWLFTNGTLYILNSDGTYRDILPFEQRLVDLPRAPLDLGFSRSSDEMTIPELQDQIQLQQAAGQPRRVKRLRLVLQLKYSIPFACLVFAFIGTPLGMRLQRTSSALGFGLSILVIFGYYALLSISQGLGQAGTIAPIAAAWLPNGMGMVVGAGLLYRVARA
ncbi:LptF/LptG family permease [Synechococcus sp. PCC 7336]|uniref:LptF/LptG family permease n=1 Tax=Synechococcus sp. PCC 7336 TaxID=195250 RepID=UPI00034C715F|nr:LptF/LptG family permease [Synechococcus sp. PCC 7336]